MMEKISNFMDKWMVPVATFMNKNKYISCIRDAFAILMPMIIAGSFALLFNIYICGTTGLAGISGLEWLSNFSGMFSTVNYACINCMALWTTLIVGYLLGEKNEQKPLVTMIIAGCCFLSLLNPETISSDLGASSLFLSFFVSILSIVIFSKLMNNEKIKIKLPSSVPPMISNSFNALIPACITLFIFGIAGGILYGTTGMYLNDILYGIIQRPFNSIVGSQLGVSLIVIFTQLLWWFGIHGTFALNPIAQPVQAAALAANMAAVAAGTMPEEVYTKAFMHLFSNLGGGGIVISLALAIMVFSKKKEEKQICKISMIPLICGISEPVVFGLPIMLNPVYLIPFVLAPLVTTNIGYIAIQAGFLTSNYVESISGMPMFIQQFLAYNGQFSALLLVVVNVVIAFIIYAPFVIMANKKELNSEVDAIEE